MWEGTRLTKYITGFSSSGKQLTLYLLNIELITTDWLGWRPWSFVLIVSTIFMRFYPVGMQSQ